MRTTITYENVMTEIANIEPGECFMRNDEVYMRIKPYGLWAKETVAIRLSDGVYTSFICDARVRPVAVNITVTDVLAAAESR